MKTTTFKQEVTVNAHPVRVYDLLMDSKKHSELTGSEAVISKTVGGKFSVYDGYAQGVNVELIPAKRIVQTWRAQEVQWPKDHFSEVTFELLPAPGGNCKICFVHRYVPAEIADNFKQGWKDHYWKPMKKLFK